MHSDAQRTSVIVVDDDPFVRRSLRDALQGAGMIVAADGRDAREGMELALHYRPDVILMDIVMPGLDGITATRRLLEQAPELRVLLLTQADDAELGLLGLRAGAAGHLVKTVDADAVVAAVRQIASGEPVLGAELTVRLIEQLRRVPEDGRGVRPVRSDLTAREWEVLDLMCEDMSAEQVAEALVISPHTARTHIKRILRKLSVHSRAEAVRAARLMRADFGVPGATAPTSEAGGRRDPAG